MWIKRHYCYRLLPAAFLLAPGFASAAENPVLFDVSTMPPGILYQTGVAYMNGDGVKQNLEQGRYWLHLAARQGVPLAQYNLGVMFYDGIGGERDPSCAQWWLQHAYNQQQDSDVHLMAEQALSALISEAWLPPKIYRVPVLSDCNRLPTVYGTDTGATDTGLAPYTEKYRILWNAEVASLIQQFNDVILVFKEKRLSFGSADKVTQVTSPDSERVKLPGATTGQHAVSYLPAKIPEINEPELSKNSPLMQGSPEKTALSSLGSSERIHEEVIPAREPRTAALPTPLQALPKKKSVTQKTGSDKELITEGNLRTASGKHFTIQLAGAETPEGLYTRAKQYHLKHYLVYETARHNRRWYVLVAGEYPTRRAALQAIASLPSEFQKNGAWVRTLRQVQSELIHVR